VVWNGVSFPRAALPAQIVAMIKPAAAPPPVVQRHSPDRAAARPHLAADIIARAPELPPSAAPRDMPRGHAEGHAAGVAAERARLKAIDELGIAGCEDIVIAAKYGDKPQTAARSPWRCCKAGRAGAELLAQRRARARRPARQAGDPRQASTAEEARQAAKNMVRRAPTRARRESMSESFSYENLIAGTSQKDIVNRPAPCAWARRSRAARSSAASPPPASGR
jgi:hypothetical protein